MYVPAGPARFMESLPFHTRFTSPAATALLPTVVMLFPVADMILTSYVASPVRVNPITLVPTARLNALWRTETLLIRTAPARRGEAVMVNRLDVWFVPFVK